MPVKVNHQVVRKFTLIASVMNGDGSPHDEELTIIHKPVTQVWLDEWSETLEREQKELWAEVEKIQQRAKEAKARNEEFDGEAAVESLKAGRQKNFIIRQMASILVDIDHVDEQGNKIPPTEDFLATRDLAFIEEIKESIEKKAFASRMR